MTNSVEIMLLGAGGIAAGELRECERVFLAALVDKFGSERDVAAAYWAWQRACELTDDTDPARWPVNERATIERWEGACSFAREKALRDQKLPDAYFDVSLPFEP
ncbi:hypothetical protein [Ramlibacter alkalitolerans]|uniref:Uncharacterized protein n=1 Tax=Ramlibacter alkalitolerans TaxID=2039631 RepID=A0ABS1JVW0_9BURK|nr:hypothetical protein [Ramlibacter alkalitolerans]MBL0427680.1 hypothetical protein [Ramlibacter alkalitolerans]